MDIRSSVEGQYAPPRLILDALAALPYVSPLMLLHQLGVTPRGVEALGALQPGVRDLILSGVTLTPGALGALSRHLPQLEELALVRCDGVSTGEVCAFLGRCGPHGTCPSLKTLTLEEVEGVDSRECARVAAAFATGVRVQSHDNM